MNQKKLISILLASLLIVTTSAFVWYVASERNRSLITNYEECAAAGYPILESYPEQCRIPDGKTFTRTTGTTSESITVSGTLVCLPHKDMDSPHTMECAIGIQTDDTTYYGITSDPYDSSLSEVRRKVEITGTLRADSRSQYNSSGIITVTSHTFVD
jgi:hypothetical protein